MAIESMGKFTSIGMRTKVSDTTALVINTCGANDTTERGDYHSWSWSNPTNRKFSHVYCALTAVSTEALWQGMKIRPGMTEPDFATLAGDWRRGKGKKPIGAWAGFGQPLITSPGAARRAIYIPAFRRQIESWLEDDTVMGWIVDAKEHPGPVFLRDHDTGRGIDRNGPMSHAWVLAMWLNTGKWPD